MLSFLLRTECTWDGLDALPSETASVSVDENDSGVALGIDAPYHEDPAPKGVAGSLWELWEWEVVELFILGKDERYLEIEVGPHGHYLALRLHGERNIIDHGHALNVDVQISGDRWTGQIDVPARLLPEKPWRVNAYAIHGTGDERRYLASFAVPGPHPDYHRLAYFRNVDELTKDIAS